MRKLRLATVFSGIGAVEFALKRMNVEHEIIFACDNGERDDLTIDYENEYINICNLDGPNAKQKYLDDLYKKTTKKSNFVEKSYLANYDCSSDKFYQDIKLLDGRDFCDKVDLLVGGSPCQSFSSVGSQGGLNDARGTLFYEFARLIKEIKPKVFIYENVRNLINHDKGNTWTVIKSIFDSLGYNIDFKVLNAVDFGIPQKRNRLFVVGYQKEFGLFPNIPLEDASKKNKYVMQDFLLSRTGFGEFSFDKSSGELVLTHDNPEQIDDYYFLSDAVKKYVMKDGTKNWHQKVEIDLPIARTLLKTMGNCHRAGVDNYVTENKRIRMLTEREALRLMGYTDDYKIVVSKAQAYKQAGNSIVVDVMMSVLSSIFESKIFNEE